MDTNNFEQDNKVMVIIILLIVLWAGYFIFDFKMADFGKFFQPGARGLHYSEQEEIARRQMTFDELKEYFKDLADKKGARYAFEVLKTSQFMPNIDLHLLGHIVGDALYKQEGADGMAVCTNDFRNACSHAIVVGLFYDRGEDALAIISEACRKAPGGSGAYTMCFHGLGHGVLAYTGYDMEKTVEICKQAGQGKDLGEVTQCISGSVMEIIGGGFHDRNLWETQRPKYLDQTDPLSLCRKSFIPEQSRFLCYDYLTPYLFEAVGADRGHPNEDDFKKAFKLCDGIPENEPRNRDSCFGGFGKEFDVLVQDRDIRLQAFVNISSEKLKQIYTWCLLAGEQQGTAACIVHAMNSLYWGGENDRKVAIRFCAVIEDNYFQKSCFMNLIDAVFYYSRDSEYERTFCDEIPSGYRSKCRYKMQINT